MGLASRRVASGKFREEEYGKWEIGVKRCSINKFFMNEDELMNL